MTLSRLGRETPAAAPGVAFQRGATGPSCDLALA